jgi:acyl-CoA dehydrogenase
MTEGANRRANPYYSDEHEAFRDSVRRFVAAEIEPYASEWDEAGTFPRELYQKAAEIGIMAVGYAEEYGGVPGDLFYQNVIHQELARPGCAGVLVSLLTHEIGTPPIAAIGSHELKLRVLPEILSGRKISALAITEPSGGSDVANLKTRAVRDGEFYVVNGSKTFISSGVRADYYTVAVRGGISFLLVEKETPGFSQTRLAKMGWWASDTATLYFEDCRVPAANLIGEENQGFIAIMLNFNAERLGIAASALALARVAVEESTAYARERQTFGKPLIENQVIRHKIVDMTMQVAAGEAWLDRLTWAVEEGERPVAEISMLKNFTTNTMEFCANEAMQIFGGAGYLRGAKVERIYRDTKPFAIGGGSVEIMKDLAARQLGL